MGWLRKFWNRHFVKHQVHYVQTGIIAVRLMRDGKKYLVLAKTGKDGKIWQQNFLVEHLLDENMEVTEQTLAEEKEWFREPVRL